MRTTLDNISSIRSGTYARVSKTGTGVYLQAKHFDDAGRLRQRIHPDITLDDGLRKHLVQPGDILFAAKGPRNFGALIPQDFPAAVASTTFFVVSPRRDVVLPEYLAWVLNHPRTQARLRYRAKGSSIVSIERDALGSLQVPVPSLEKQRGILEIEELSVREDQLRSAIADLRRRLIHQQIRRAIN